MTERHTTRPFPEALRELMSAKGIDQPRLAALAELNQSSISRYLDGLRRPSLSSMESIARALEISPDFFLEYQVDKVKEIMEKRPELASRVYQEAVKLAARDPSRS